MVLFVFWVYVLNLALAIFFFWRFDCSAEDEGYLFGIECLTWKSI